MAVTIKEVAQAAGVSAAAVSKVLHGRGTSVRVSVERAAHIREVAKGLSYYPNALARSLRSSRTHTVGLLFENFHGIAAGPLYYMHLLDGVASELFKAHYRLTILPELNHDDVIGTLADGRLDGVIWCKLAREEKVLRLIQECPIPIVALNTPAGHSPGDAVFVACDNEGGIELAVDHLWNLGHRRILFVREQEEVNVPDGVARLAGFQMALADRGVNLEPEDIATWWWDMEQFADWWASHPPHTAMICWSERCAAQILQNAQALGIKVPEQLSVVGFDSTQFCETTKPRMTAVRQPIGEMAARASQLLLAMIEGKTPSNSSYTYPCGLDIRDSTARPRS